MSAKDVLLMTMVMRHVAEDTAREIIDAALREHAHDLAERIRNSEELRDHTDDHMGDCEAAADLIDPEVAWP